MTIGIASLLELENVLFVSMDLSLVKEANPLHLRIVLNIVLQYRMEEIRNRRQ